MIRLPVARSNAHARRRVHQAASMYWKEVQMTQRIWPAVAAAAAVLVFGAGATVGSGQGGHESHGGSMLQQQGGKAKGKSKEERALFAVLLGRNELAGDPLRRGAGDPDGRGSSNVTIDGTSVCFGIAVTNISQPVAAHIHRGRRNENGPVVVTLVHPATGDPGASSGCTETTAALASEIQRHPRRFYVNVHTADFPGGAVRGQLFAKRR
jgi:CHRD domain-containing protein